MTNLENPDILIVEDDKNDADLIMRSLKKVNLANNLLHLRDGAEALDFLFARKQFNTRNITNVPRVILLDIKMPRVDGIEVLRQIKSNEILKMIPIVIMTSSKEERDIIKSYNLGVSSFVVKPVEFENFARAVSDVGMYWLIINQPPIIKPQLQ